MTVSLSALPDNFVACTIFILGWPGLSSWRMADDDGLLAIQISSADESDTPSTVPRNHQSEADFQKVKASWTPKVENGELWRQLVLPVDHPSKPGSQVILHSIEELYFFKKYDEAIEVTEKALEGKLQDEFRKILEDYHRRCLARLKERQS